MSRSDSDTVRWADALLDTSIRYIDAGTNVAQTCTVVDHGASVRRGEYFGVRDDALRAHATQVDPDGFWFHVPMELQLKVWPTEDFELARSLVDSPLPESDLFAGIRETVEAR